MPLNYNITQYLFLPHFSAKVLRYINTEDILHDGNASLFFNLHVGLEPFHNPLGVLMCLSRSAYSVSKYPPLFPRAGDN